MISCLMVGIGGFFGSILRYLVSLIPLGDQGSFPYKTLITNVVGAFLIGLIVALSLNNPSFNEKYVLLLKTGFCGGFTTFSTFSQESVSLFQGGKVLLAIVYIVLSIVLCIGAILLAQFITKTI